MALLRASSSALGAAIDVAHAMDGGAGVPAGDVLLRFATAAHLDDPDLPVARRAVRAALGPVGLAEASLTVGAFNGLTRVADATGIALDGGTLAATPDLRADLGLNAMAGAASTEAVGRPAGAPRFPETVAELFRD
ncbi:MAG: hypothetical protein ABW219_04275 [Ilumatobacteraceae bacterium]